MRPPPPSPHASSANPRTLSRLIGRVAAHPALAATALLFVLLSTGSILALTVAGRFAIDHAGLVRSRRDLLAPFGGLGLVAAVFAATTGLRIYFVTTLGERVAGDLRRALYDAVLRLDPLGLQGLRPGDVLARMTSDVTAVENLAGNLASVTLRNVFSLVGAVALIVALRPAAALLLLLAPVLLAPLVLFRRRLRALAASAQDRFADAIGFAGESLDGLETVQAFGQERRASTRFAAAVEAAVAAARTRARTRAALATGLILVVFLGLFAVLGEGAYATYVARTMSAGVLVQLGVLSLLAASAASALGEVWGEAQKALAAMRRIGAVLDARPCVASPARPVALPVPARGEVSLEAVSFAYPGGSGGPTLHEVSLHVAPGERVALVGPSGAGKSTVFKLLLRFYDPQSGAVRLDGVDLRDASLEAVRGAMALVAQDPALFSGPVGDNVGFGVETAEPEEIAAAVAAAQVDAFLRGRPEGLALPVGERGRSLSGGQRQRVALARALLRDAPILLLDEATSALDAENERLVQDALAAGRARTTLIIAHRLSTVLAADRIVVMDAGRIVEVGRHAELVGRGGLYARLAALQFMG